MLTFKEYISEDITYSQWCEALDYIEKDSLNEGFLDKVKIPKPILKIVASIHMDIKKLIKMTKVDIKDIINAFKEPHIFKILKAVKFSIKTLYDILTNTYNVGLRALFTTFEALNKSKVFQKVRKGTIKIDEVLNKYPILKKLTGPVIAGLLLYMWLNMTFVGDIDYDMDISAMFSAFMGKFSVEDLFGSDKGNMLIALFSTGFVFGLSMSWLGKATYNVVLALVYTGIKYSKSKSPSVGKLKTVINKG